MREHKEILLQDPGSLPEHHRAPITGPAEFLIDYPRVMGLLPKPCMNPEVIGGLPAAPLAPTKAPRSPGRIAKGDVLEADLNLLTAPRAGLPCGPSAGVARGATVSHLSTEERKQNGKQEPRSHFLGRKNQRSLPPE